MLLFYSSSSTVYGWFPGLFFSLLFFSFSHLPYLLPLRPCALPSRADFLLVFLSHCSDFQAPGHLFSRSSYMI